MKEIKVNGVLYKSLREAADAYNISYQKLRLRWLKGLTDEMLVFSGNMNECPCRIGGVTYPSVSDAARKLGINLYILQMRIKRGTDLSLPVGYRLRRFAIDNREFLSIKDACKAYGISDNLVRGRLHLGWSVERAIKTPPKNETAVNGKIYASLSDACKAYKIKTATVRKRIKLGFTVDEAVMTPLFKLKRHKDKKR